MRIVHALASYEVGGGEMLALRLAGWQRRAGHDVSVVALDAAGPLAERFEAAGVATQVVAKRPGFDLTLFPRLSAFFLRRRVDVVHTHNPQTLVYAAPAAKALWRGVVHTKHGEAADTGRRLGLRRAAATCVGAFVSVSADTDRFAREHGEAAPQKLHVVENGVELSLYVRDGALRRSARQELGWSEETFAIGAVGRLQPVKNYGLLLRAAAPLLGPERRLLLLGDGPERGSLEQLAGELGVTSQVHFLGYRSDVPRWLQALDCFAISSHTEGLPLVLIEAMASGLPAVSTAVGGIPAVLEGCGVLVPEGDEEALRVALQSLADDPGRADELAAAGLERVRGRYAFAAMAERYEQIYRQALAARRPWGRP